MPDEIPSSQIVGAVQDGKDLRVWFMPLVSTGKAHKRNLHTTPVLTFSSSEAAAATRLAIIRANCWGGAETARRLQVFINPCSGPHAGQKIWERISPLICSAAGIKCTITVSTAPGHLTAAAQELDLTGNSGILVVGGDGTVFEALQGLLNRPDWDIARQIPLVQVPAGSGNALCASVRLADEWHAAFAAVKGSSHPMDAASLFHPARPRIFSFLSVTTGLLANLDHGTEGLRWMGEFRFTLGAIYEIMLKRTTQVRVRYLTKVNAAKVKAGADGAGETGAPPSGPPCPILSSLGVTDVSSTTSLSQLRGHLPEEWAELPCTDVQLMLGANLPWMATSAYLAPPARLNDGAFTLVWTPKVSQLEGLDLLLKSESGDHMTLPFLHHVKAAALLLEPLDSNDTLIVVDGELLPTAPVYLEVHHELLSVLVDPEVLGE
eukprot:CAMPEP_0117659538 /NCGR_PEP_ID=MMETSP0804-20121206/6487_1 /TAXON_ID=1074897 /ORGANISM="Tetraselmis astigmatica, Strain CCMP880" /LENGTH=434 /DNA_ID=CAMNT_0005466205 /DNA_START=239 /DNA_END=1543 /DNA_ORIENTATION=+